jgi:hypothetical protein
MSYEWIACLVFMAGVGAHSYARVKKFTCVLLVFFSPLVFLPLAGLVLLVLAFVARLFAFNETFHLSDEWLKDIFGVMLIGEAFAGIILFGKILRSRGPLATSDSNVNATGREKLNQPSQPIPPRRDD